MKTKILSLKYIGKGDALPNVPARDLSPDEFSRFDENTRAAILACGLYEVEKEK